MSKERSRHTGDNRQTVSESKSESKIVRKGSTDRVNPNRLKKKKTGQKVPRMAQPIGVTPFLKKNNKMEVKSGEKGLTMRGNPLLKGEDKCQRKIHQ